jgi:hypothetical protein
MDIKTALDTAFNASTQFHSFEKLSTFLDPLIIPLCQDSWGLSFS